jgi:hypothetical protein
MDESIQKDDLPHLSLLCGVEVGDPIPKEVLAHYGRARRMTSRLGNMGPLPATTLIQVGLCAGLGYEIASDEHLESFADKVRLGKVISGDEIEVLWRNEPVRVQFQMVRSDGEVEVLFRDHKAPRAIPFNDCKAIFERAMEPETFEKPDGVTISKRRLRLAEEQRKKAAKPKAVTLEEPKQEPKKGKKKELEVAA